MQVAGIITEYNPLHSGHVHLMEEVRRLLGPETAVVCVMSGNFVQRGDFAIVGKHARARAAVESGMDLVLELPLPWAVASAERFADGGVQVLLGTGLVSHIAFGSECGDADALERAAKALLSPELGGFVRRELTRGDSYAAARQRALRAMLPTEDAALLESPNNILGVEYCKALLRRDSAIRPLTVRRRGTGYHGTELEGGVASATMVRSLLRNGERERALDLMAPDMKTAYLE